MHIFASKYKNFFHRTIRAYMVDKRITRTPMLVASMAERYKCLSSDHECGGSNPRKALLRKVGEKYITQHKHVYIK